MLGKFFVACYLHKEGITRECIDGAACVRGWGSAVAGVVASLLKFRKGMAGVSATLHELP